MSGFLFVNFLCMLFTYEHIPIVLREANFPTGIELALVEEDVEICCQLIYLDAIGMLWDCGFAKSVEYDFCSSKVQAMAAAAYSVMRTRRIPEKFHAHIESIKTNRRRRILVGCYSSKLNKYYNKDIETCSKEDIAVYKLTPAAFYEDDAFQLCKP